MIALWANTVLTQNQISQLSKFLRDYHSLMDKYVSHKGKAHTVKLFKDIHNLSKMVALNASHETLPWIRSSKDGIPSVLRPLVPFLRGTPEMKRAALTITRSYELITLKPDLDVSAIISPQTAPIPQELKAGFAT